MHRSESRNTSTFGTNRSISSVTREPINKVKRAMGSYRVPILPFKLLTQRSSRFRSRLSSFKERSSGIVDKASLAMVKSKGIPII
jgi:hypothetical protein